MPTNRDMIRYLRAWGLIMLGVLILAFAVHACNDDAEAATASCYGPGLYGNTMASGAILYPSTIAVAHKTLDIGGPHTLGDRLMIYTGHGTARMVAVRDRGPYVHGRELDLTEGAVRILGISSCSSWGVREVRTWRYPYRS